MDSLDSLDTVFPCSVLAAKIGEGCSSRNAEMNLTQAIQSLQPPDTNPLQSKDNHEVLY